MRDTGKVVLTFIGSIIFCVAVVGTIQSFRNGGAGSGPMVGSIAIGVGLAMLVIPWLRDGTESQTHPRATRDSHRQSIDA